MPPQVITIITKILDEALNGLTDFGTGEILILLFVVSYYEMRFKIMNKKQTETDFNVISLENDTLKNVNDVKSATEKRLNHVVDRLQSGEASNEEVLAILVGAMRQLKAEAEAVWAKTDREIKDNWKDVNDDFKDNMNSAIHGELRRSFDEALERLNEQYTSLLCVKVDLETFMMEARMRLDSLDSKVLQSVKWRDYLIDIDLEIEETQEKNELHDFYLEEMEAEDPEKYVFTPVEEVDEPNIIHVLEERLEKL